LTNLIFGSAPKRGGSFHGNLSHEANNSTVVH